MQVCYGHGWWPHPGATEGTWARVLNETIQGSATGASRGSGGGVGGLWVINRDGSNYQQHLSFDSVLVLINSGLMGHTVSLSNIKNPNHHHYSSILVPFTAFLTTCCR